MDPLAHYYQESEIQDLADFGDSLSWPGEGAKSQSSPCGVHFMAETTKILTLEKTVVVPDLRRVLAGRRCPAPSSPSG
jgi:quinolinate synthase